MMFLSSLLIRLIGPRNYLRIPYCVRARLGMHRGEDFSDIMRVLEQIQAARVPQEPDLEGIQHPCA